MFDGQTHGVGNIIEFRRTDTDKIVSLRFGHNTIFICIRTKSAESSPEKVPEKKDMSLKKATTYVEGSSTWRHLAIVRDLPDTPKPAARALGKMVLFFIDFIESVTM
jgi:hypothetical protein